MTLVPFSFSPIRSEEPAREVSSVLPALESVGAKMLRLEEVIIDQLEAVLESVGAKMLRLEEVIIDQLEAVDHVLVEKVAEHMLTCFRSRDPIISLDPIALRPITETEEAARGSVHEAAKAVAARFQCMLEDA
jgi:hypothetical protein